MKSNVQIIDNASDGQIADWLEARILDALEGTAGPVALALPGGSTPFPILAQLADRDIEWGRILAYPTDDRLVPADHPASNTGKLRHLLEPLGARVCGLDEVAPLSEPVPGGATLPSFALVWLGMGADGHVASLFPNINPRVDDSQWIRRLTPDPLPPEAPFDRITLTIPALLNAEELLFVMRGADKRRVLDAAMVGASDLPVARLLGAATHHRVTCFT